MTKHMIFAAQIAPAVRVAIGEGFGMEPGSILTGKLVSALRALGFDKVYDTQFAADLTIIEEGTEFIERFQNNGKLPMFTSCCPGWVHFMETQYPDLTDHLSSCKSPQQMFGAVLKTYIAKRENVAPENIVLASIMPCNVKKNESQRLEMSDAFSYWHEQDPEDYQKEFPDVDFVVTTAELIAMIQQQEIDFANLPESAFDNPLGLSSAAGTLFGNAGGVMEAALRTVLEKLEVVPPDADVSFEGLRANKPLRTHELTIGEQVVRIAVAHTVSQAKQLCEDVRQGKSQYHFIEVMNCESGCIGGGGQPSYGAFKEQAESKLKRKQGLYNNEENHAIRKSHNNPAIKELYEDFLGEPNGELAHHLLHTHYHSVTSGHPDHIAEVPLSDTMVKSL